MPTTRSQAAKAKEEEDTHAASSQHNGDRVDVGEKRDVDEIDPTKEDKPPAKRSKMKKIKGDEPEDAIGEGIEEQSYHRQTGNRHSDSRRHGR